MRMGKVGIGIFACVFLLCGCGNSQGNPAEMIETESSRESDPSQAEAYVETQESADDEEQATLPLEISLEISDYFITNTGDPSNLYHIDEDKVLWGCGRNNYGQLGQGTQDYGFVTDMVKIAENVVHVDYSGKGFTIYLTEDHELYGFGNAGGGALQQYDEFSVEYYINGEHHVVPTPILLMEDVIYARCGRDDMVALKADGSVWVWGTLWYSGGTSCYYKEPVQVLEDAVLVTGGFFHHAALQRDGSVWTWGYNYSGNCGVEDESVISQPRKIAEDAVMVWTTTRFNVEEADISEFGGSYEREIENTIIQKSDDSYWICGAYVGTEEKLIPEYYEVRDWTMICTSEFQPYEGKTLPNAYVIE